MEAVNCHYWRRRICLRFVMVF